MRFSGTPSQNAAWGYPAPSQSGNLDADIEIDWERRDYGAGEREAQ
jgi:hypothetical protein